MFQITVEVVESLYATQIAVEDQAEMLSQVLKGTSHSATYRISSSLAHCLHSLPYKERLKSFPSDHLPVQRFVGKPNASDGSIGAHRAVLTACLPIFDLMFTHELKEKDLCIIEIPEMSIKFYQPFLSYLYSNKIQSQDLLSHRLDLLRVADTYDVSDLKDVCQDILIEDIDLENVMERLQTAFRYHLPRLKICCIDYLVKFASSHHRKSRLVHLSAISVAILPYSSTPTARSGVASTFGTAGNVLPVLKCHNEDPGESSET
ncbi:SKP1/BTB/POZ domain-containing protein, partial [Tanacetum coccineum]